MINPSLWAELLAYGSGVSISPIHIGLMLLLLLGPNPLRRGGLLLLSWLATIALIVTLLLTVGHRLEPPHRPGSAGRRGLAGPRHEGTAGKP